MHENTRFSSLVHSLTIMRRNQQQLIVIDADNENICLEIKTRISPRYFLH